MKAHHVSLTDYSDTDAGYGDLYDDIQIGEVEAKIGYVFNRRWYMYNSFHLAPLPDPDETLYHFTEKVLNKSTGDTFTDKFIDTESGDRRKHLQVLESHKEEFTL